MIVCPACRAVNDEEREACSACGGTLAPGPASLLARRAPRERVEVEVPAPRRPSRARPYVVFGALIALMVTAGALVVLRPDPCADRSFSSEAFGYCLTVPTGWDAAPARFANGATLDGFSDGAGSAAIFIEAVDLASGTALEAWEGKVRKRDREAGLTPGNASDTSVAGVPARRWDVTSTSEDGTQYRTREIVLVKDDVGWRVTLNESEAGFEIALDALDSMLGTWAFR